MTQTTFEQFWGELDPIGRAGSGGYRRFAWTAEDQTLREWFAGHANRLGLDLVEDRAGNQWAWWGNPDEQQGIAIGSHLDSVPDGGAFDGPLGVVSSLAVVERLKADGFTPSRPVAVVNFIDEEGARFGVACGGSRLITGQLTADRARGLKDVDGLTMAEALTRAGRRAELVGRDEEALGRIAAFVELHVEQGRALIDLDPEHAAVAVGTDIWPHGRWRLDIPGMANHAGTTRLVDRQDAMLPAAELIIAARQIAAAHGVVTTVGKIEATPNGVNAIPSHVTLWMDCRGADESAVRAAVAQMDSEVTGRNGRFGEESWTPTTYFDAPLANRLQGVLGGAKVPMLGTGAGHDAGILAGAGVPTAMLFVRNPTGVSHSPEEFAEVADCVAGIDALEKVVRELAG